MGKQEGKLTEVEVFASNCPISQVKVAESMQWEKGVGFSKKDEKAGGFETCSSGAEHVGPSCIDVKIPGVPFIGPNLVVTTQAHIGVVKDSTEPPHQTPIPRPESLKLTPDAQVRKWIRIDRPAQDSFIKLPNDEIPRERPKIEASETQPAKRRGVCSDEVSSQSISSVVAESQPHQSP